jgi:mono/diheme cytochrome c family protein
MLTPFLILAALLVFGFPALLQEPGGKPETTAPAPAPSAQAAMPAEAVNMPNPVRPTPESLARAKHIYDIDCAMCHGEDGGGKGDITTTVKLRDYRDPASLRDLTDGQIFYIIKNGKGDMPPEGERAKTDETWNMVLYLRSFSKPTVAKQGPSQ